jgi:polyisoprenoid-binding protein YceI
MHLVLRQSQLKTTRGDTEMKSFLLGAVAALTLGASAYAESYTFDPGHTEVRFYYNHAGLSEQSGEWTVTGGEVEFDASDLAATKVSVTIDASSIDTGVDDLDGHLKSGDFFDVGNHPEITFVSTGATQTGADRITLVGDLTIKGVSKPVTLDFVLNHNGPHPLGQFVEYYEGDWIGVQGGGELLRSEFGVGMFAPLTSDRVRLAISAELKKGGW